MAEEQRVEEDDQVDTEPGMESEQDDSEAEEEGDLTKLLEPFSKEQLIDMIRSVVSRKNKDVIEEIHRQADQHPSHCELFVNRLGWETTSDQLKEIFSAYGEIENCKIIVDKNTGRSREYGFIVYKHRKSVSKALKEPVKLIGDRMTRCYLASRQQQQRKISVDNVHSEISVMKLYSYFLKYGEIEAGPLGYDKHTMKFKGCASFIYKHAEGARRALEEPVKRFDGYTLYCQMAIDDKRKHGSTRVGGFSPHAGDGSGFNTQNWAAQTYGHGVAQPYGLGIPSGAAASKPYGQGILSRTAQPYGQGTEHVEAALAVPAAAGQSPSALSAMNPSLAGLSSESMSPATSQREIQRALGTGNLVCQNPRSHTLNTSDQIAPSENGPAKRLSLGYYVKKLGLFIVFFVGILFLLTIVL
ncbi:hypothetical protein MKW94_008282 [Papaver nudicaule]|uniref:RRM domain-containing protein n=1 Tax=Papaver nudicaule TaxID=74823 RepID=A0AA41V9B6_PAPNU|nr:hypothetical protein [Papaver nudicaule]